mgnify:CR=1 FL=1
MLTYKEIVAKFREKNSKQPEATWKYESWFDSFEQGPRSGYQGGQLVDHGPGRQGYGGTRGKKMYLVNYSFDEMVKDLNAGKLKREIAEKLYNKNPKYFENIPATKKAGTNVSKVTSIVSALSSRIRYHPDLLKLDNKNTKNFEKLNKMAIKDIESFVKKNAPAYKKLYESNKIGALSSFKEKILDYASDKYPKFVKRSTGSKNLPANQRLFTSFSTLGRDVTRAGEYGLEKQLNKLIRKGIGVPERPLAGEGQSLDRMRRNYNKDLLGNLKKAQALGAVPTINPITKKPINTVDAYYRYIEKKEIDPIRKLFGNNYKFGQEHVGGIARARVINDVESLTRITAMDSFANKSLKGGGSDKKMSNLMKLAKQSSGETSKRYLDSINKLSAETDKRFGLDSPKYKLVNNEIKAVYSKGALDDSTFGQAKRAVKTFTATERYKDPNFKLLDKDLQKSIISLKKGDVKQSDKLLKKTVTNILSNSGIRCGQAKGINCSDPRAYIKSINELKAKAALGDKAALGKFRKVANAMRKFKGAAAFTGWGLLAEVGFALPFAAMDYADGKSTAQIMNNASFGLFGMNAEEEAVSFLPEGSLGGAITPALEAGERVKKLEDPNRVFPQGRLGMDKNRSRTAQKKVIADANLDFTNKLAPFLEGPRNEYINFEKANKASEDIELARAQLKAKEEQKAKEIAAGKQRIEDAYKKQEGRTNYDNSLPNIFEEDK